VITLIQSLRYTFYVCEIAHIIKFVNKDGKCTFIRSKVNFIMFWYVIDVNLISRESLIYSNKCKQEYGCGYLAGNNKLLCLQNGRRVGLVLSVQYFHIGIVI
jgi:hypothetical protein